MLCFVQPERQATHRKVRASSLHRLQSVDSQNLTGAPTDEDTGAALDSVVSPTLGSLQACRDGRQQDDQVVDIPSRGDQDRLLIQWLVVELSGKRGESTEQEAHEQQVRTGVAIVEGSLLEMTALGRDVEPSPTREQHGHGCHQGRVGSDGDLVHLGPDAMTHIAMHGGRTQPLQHQMRYGID